MNESKVSAYLGFSLKAGKLTLGIDGAERLKSGVYLLMLCASASENTKKQAKKLQERFSCPLLLCEQTTLAELIHRPNCKFIAVRDKNLAEAITRQRGEGLSDYAGGKN